MEISVTEDATSMRVEFSLKNLKNITALGKRQGFYRVGVIARDIIKKNISALPRSGAVDYYRGRKRHASLPGESFANRSKDAQRTLGFDVRGSEYLEFGFRANQKTKYVRFLEEGTATIRRRPTMQIASAETVGIAQTILLSELEKAHLKGTL